MHGSTCLMPIPSLRMCTCMYVCSNACMYKCVYVCMYVCYDVCMYVCKSVAAMLCLHDLSYGLSSRYQAEPTRFAFHANQNSVHRLFSCNFETMLSLGAAHDRPTQNLIGGNVGLASARFCGERPRWPRGPIDFEALKIKWGHLRTRRSSCGGGCPGGGASCCLWDAWGQTAATASMCTEHRPPRQPAPCFGEAYVPQRRWHRRGCRCVAARATRPR